MYSIVFEFDYRKDGVVEIARIQDDQVFGPEAQRVKQLLVEGGWPQKPPHWVLYGTYLYATKPIEGDAFSG